MYIINPLQINDTNKQMNCNTCIQRDIEIQYRSNVSYYLLERRAAFLMRCVSFLSTHLISFESFHVSREYTASTNAFYCSYTQSQ